MLTAYQPSHQISFHRLLAGWFGCTFRRIQKRLCSLTAFSAFENVCNFRITVSIETRLGKSNFNIVVSVFVHFHRRQIERDHSNLPVERESYAVPLAITAVVSYYRHAERVKHCADIRFSFRGNSHIPSFLYHMWACAFSPPRLSKIHHVRANRRDFRKKFYFFWNILVV